MASYTSNLNLKKPALTDDALVTDLNDNSDKLDAAISAGSGAIAIVSVGNTHAAISSGQYVYVRQHGSLSEGLYKATTNIAANGTLSGSNLTAVSGGGLNSVYSALSDQIANNVIDTLHISDSINVPANGIASAQFSISGKSGYTLVGCLLRCSNNMITTGFARTSGGQYYYTLANGYTSALTTSLDAVLFYKKNS